MAAEEKRTIGYICPVCRNSVIIEKSVFQLAAAKNRLPCPCGKSAVETAAVMDRVQFTVPCLLCDRTHTVTCSASALVRQRALAFSCAGTGLDCCYVGQEEAVFEAMQRLERTVDGAEAEAGERGMFLNPIVMEETLAELKDIAARGAISCTCGSRAWRMRIRYSAVELECADCGGALKIPAGTDDDLTDLCYKDTLLIRGKNG